MFITPFFFSLAKGAARFAPVIAVVACILGTVARAAEIHIGLSPFMDDSQRQQVSGALPEMILQPKNLPGGNQVIIWDAWRLVRIAEFSLPVRNFDTSRARAARLEGAFMQLGRWLRQPCPTSEGLPAGSAALRIPEWLFAASAGQASGPRCFILLGSPLYRCPSEPAFDMGEDARYPSDGHLALSLEASVFGLAEKADRLARASVLWCFFSNSVWMNPLHEHQVTRFWTLFVQGQGGTLGTFGPDLSATLTCALQTDLAPVLRAQPDPADEKPLMRSARPRQLPAWLEAPILPPPPPAIVSPATPAPAAPPAPVAVNPEPVAPMVTTTPLVREETPPASAIPVVAAPPAPVPVPALFDSSKTGIGIAWSAPVDLDLYVMLRPGVKELYYNRDRTPEGFLYKDERQANAGHQFEFIEFRQSGPVDLGQATVWVNYYGGRAQNVTGQVALFEHGRVKVGSFVLPAARGNHGGSSRERAGSPYWVQIRLGDLVEASAPLTARKPGKQ